MDEAVPKADDDQSQAHEDAQDQGAADASPAAETTPAPPIMDLSRSAIHDVIGDRQATPSRPKRRRIQTIDLPDSVLEVFGDQPDPPRSATPPGEVDPAWLDLEAQPEAPAERRASTLDLPDSALVDERPGERRASTLDLPDSALVEENPEQGLAAPRDLPHSTLLQGSAPHTDVPILIVADKVPVSAAAPVSTRLQPLPEFTRDKGPPQPVPIDNESDGPGTPMHIKILFVVVWVVLLALIAHAWLTH